jgi:hypothetical protein
MSCDSAWFAGDLLVTRKNKITRLPSGGLLGSAGDDDCRAVEELVGKVKTPAGLPTRKQLLDLQLDYLGILVLPKGRIFHIGIDEPASHQTHWTAGLFEISESFHAIGIGAELAISAMECGKSAREAVNITCRRSMACRPPIYTISLTPPPKTAKGKK